MLRISIARTPAEIERFRPAWESLYSSGKHSLFQSFRWNSLAARAFVLREPPLVVLAENENGSALIPACLSESGLSLLGEALFDYRDVLSSGGEDILHAAWEELSLQRRDLSFAGLRGKEAQARWADVGLRPMPFVAAPQVRTLDVSADAFAHQHGRSARLLRRLVHSGAVLREYSRPEAALLSRIYDLKGAQPLRTGENLLADPLRRKFLVEIASNEPGCEVFTLETASCLIAAIVTFRDEHTRRFYTVYYGHAWAKQSPGAALLFEVTRRSLEQNLDCDYMTGEQPHKVRLATSSVPLYRVEASAEDLAAIGRSGRLLAA